MTAPPFLDLPPHFPLPFLALSLAYHCLSLACRCRFTAFLGSGEVDFDEFNEWWSKNGGKSDPNRPHCHRPLLLWEGRIISSPPLLSICFSFLLSSLLLSCPFYPHPPTGATPRPPACHTGERGRRTQQTDAAAAARCRQGPQELPGRAEAGRQWQAAGARQRKAVMSGPIMSGPIMAAAIAMHLRRGVQSRVVWLDAGDSERAVGELMAGTSGQSRASRGDGGDGIAAGLRRDGGLPAEIECRAAAGLADQDHGDGMDRDLLLDRRADLHRRRALGGRAVRAGLSPNGGDERDERQGRRGRQAEQSGKVRYGAAVD